jgi:hypothetical protein
MSHDHDQRLSEEMAARLWQRAAELQAEADEHDEARSLQEAESEASPPGTDGYALRHVRQAAEDAGISGEFVDTALAEVAAERAVGSHGPSVFDGLAETFLDHTTEALEVRRVIAAEADTIYQAMQATFPSPPYNLALHDIQGEPQRGGTMVFDVPRVTGFTYTSFEYDMSLTSIRLLVVSIHPRREDTCEVVVRASVRFYRHLSGGMTATAAASAGLFGSLAGGAGLGLAVGTSLGLGAVAMVPLVGILGILGGGTMAGVSRSLARKLYRYGLTRSRQAIEGLLGALSVGATAGWGLGSGSSIDANPTADLLGNPGSLPGPPE